MNLQLAGLTAVLTGGSSGIGAAIVRTLAEEGCNVHFCARDRPAVERALRACAALPGQVRAEALDVTDAAAFAAWLARIGAFDIFIPNVSALSKEWEQALRTDVRATVDNTEAAAAYVARSAHGAITYIGSKASSLAAPESPAYGVGKAAMAHYMKSLALRLLPAVRVNVVSPGDTLFEGGLWDTVRQREPDQFDRVLRRNPLKRLATPQEIARVVAFISSPAASFVAGANWYVDGGSVAHVQM